MKPSILPALIAIALFTVHARNADAQALSAGGGGFTVAIDDDGTVQMFGNGPTTTGEPKLFAVSAGQDHVLGIRNSDNTLMLWDRPPVHAGDPPAGGLKAISAGTSHSLAIASNGTVHAWGSAGEKLNASGVANALAIAAGSDASLVLFTDGSVTAYGSPGNVAVSHMPTLGEGSTLAIAAGNDNGAALLANRTVQVWGNFGDMGNIGPATEPNSANAVTGDQFAAVSAGGSHALALGRNGELKGIGQFGDFGVSGTAATISDAVFITSGATHAVVVTSDGTIRQLSDGSSTTLNNFLELPTTARWATADSGDYLDSHRWAQKIPSTALSDAVFDAEPLPNGGNGENGGYTVEFGNTARARNLYVNAGDVTFNLSNLDPNSTIAPRFLVGTEDNGAIIDGGDITIAGSNNNAQFRFDNGSIEAVNANIEQNGLLQVQSNATLEVSNSINTSAGGVLDVKGTVDTANVVNAGEITVASTGALTVANSFTSTGVFNADGNVTLTSGAFTVEDGGVLGGTGTFNGAVVIGDKGTVSPGNSIGSLAVGSTTFGSGGTFTLQINDFEGTPGGEVPSPDPPTGLGWSLLSVNGTLNITANDPFTIDLASLSGSTPGEKAANFNEFQDYTLTFVTTTGGINGFDPNKFSINTTGFANSPFGTFSVQLANNGNDLVLHHTAIPEPSSFVILGLALGGLGYRARRKANKAKAAAGDSAEAQA